MRFAFALSKKYFSVAIVLMVTFCLNAQTIRYQNSVRGGLTVATNGLNLTGQTAYANTAGGATMSSYSDLVLPSDAEIVKAILYVEGYAASTITSVKFRPAGAAAYSTLTATTPGFIATTTTGSYTQFIIDVTKMVNPKGFVSTITPGGSAATTGRYSVADLAPIDPSNYGYGWSLFVVYSRPVGQYRNVTIADACVNFGIGTAVTVNVNNIAVPSAGSVNAVVIATGCWGDPGALYNDNIKFGRQGGTLTSLKDPVTGSTTDVLNGTVGFAAPNNVTVDGVPGMVTGNYLARNPYNTFGGTSGSAMYYDCDVMNASGILATSTTPISVSITQAGQGSDALGVGTYGVSVDIVSALLTKSLAPTSIADGDVARYTFTLTNTGVGANNLVGIGFTDNLPSGLMIANPNGVAITGGTGGTIVATPGSGTFTLSNFSLNAGQTATITLDVTNKPGQLNPDCSANPDAFTNGFENIQNNSANLANGVTDQCLIVTGAPKPDFSATTVCQGVATQFTDMTKVVGSNTVTAWAWDFGVTPTATSSAQNPSYTYGTAGTYTVKLTITALSGATESVTKTITVKALPTVVVKDPPGICPGASAQLDAGGGNVYAWTPAGTLNDPSLAKPTATPAATTIYTVKVTDSSTGCSKDATSKVTVFASPSPVITGATTVCPDVNSTLTASGGVSYSWLPNGETTASITINQTVETTYTVNVTDVNGCKGSKTYKVSMAPPISAANITTVPRACTSANGSITIVSVVGGMSPYVYSLNAGTYKTTNNFTSLDALEYLITVKDNKGCLFSTNVKVETTPAPTDIKFTTAPSGCGAPTGKIIVSSVTGGNAPYQYSSSGTAGTFQSTATLSPLGSGDYQLTVLDANGCQFSIMATVGSSSGPTGVNQTITADSCGKQNGSLVVNSVIGGVAPFSYSLDNVTFQSSTSFSPLPAGNVTVYVKDAGNCVYSKVLTIPAVTGVTTFDLASVTESCNLKNGSIQVSGIQGGTAPYNYSINGGSFQPSPSFSSLDSGTYTITVRGQDLCPISKTVNVGYLAPIDSVYSIVTPSTCGAANGKVVFTVFGGTSPIDITYTGSMQTWQDSVVGLLANNYVFHFTDANSCAFNQPVLVGDITGPTAIAVTTQQTSCTTPSGIIDVTGITGGTAPYLYALDNGAYTSSTNYSSLAQGSYIVRVKDANSCTFSVTASVTMVAGPTAFATTQINTTCSQSNGQVDITGVTGGNAPYEYSFNGSGYTAVTSYPGLAANPYPIVVRDANQCTFQRSVTITDSPSPTGVVVNVAPTSCGRSLGKVNIGAVTGGTPNYTYSFNGSPFTSTILYTNLAAGIYPIIVHDANNCADTASAEIKDIAGPSVPQLTFADDTCGRNSGMINVVNVSGPSQPFNYRLNAGTKQPTGLFTQVPANTVAYTVTVEDTSGCTSSNTAIISVIKGPSNPTVNLTQPHCGLPDGSATVVPASITQGTAPFKFTISPTATQSGVRFSALSGSINYTLTVSDKYSCTNSQVFTLVDIPGPQTADLIVIKSTCGASNGVVEVKNVTAGTPPYRYSDNNTSYTANSIFPGRAAGQNQQFYVKDSAGCVLNVSADVPGAPGPTDITAALLPENCFRADGAINNARSVGGTAPFVIALNNGVATAQPASFSNLAEGDYTLEVTDSNNCKLSKKFSVGFASGPQAAFTMAYDSESEAPLTVQFRNGSTGALTNTWDFGNTDGSAAVSPIYTYQDSGYFEITLVVENEAGCIDSTSQELWVKPAVSIFVPNTFSPNNDGYNDRFKITTYNMLSYLVTIYNRWGEPIASFTQLEGSWDGTYNGALVEQGVYAVAVTAIDIFRKKHHHKGVINIIQ